MRMLKKIPSFRSRSRVSLGRTRGYASVGALPAASLDSLFEHPYKEAHLT